MLQRLDHVTIRSSDLARTLHFYQTALGLCPGPRPPFALAGAWLYLHQHPVLHVVRSDAPLLPGVIDHLAFEAHGRQALTASLAGAGIDTELRPVPDGSALQLFLRDPDGARIEIVFRQPEDL